MASISEMSYPNVSGEAAGTWNLVRRAGHLIAVSLLFLNVGQRTVAMPRTNLPAGWFAAGQVRSGSPNRPTNPDHLGAAAAALAHGDIELAEWSVRAELKLHPASFSAYNLLGLIFIRRGDVEQAEASFRKALDISPSYVPALMNS